MRVGSAMRRTRAQVDRFCCNDVSQKSEIMNATMQQSTVCGGNDRWLEMHEVSIRRRNSYLWLVIALEPSLLVQLVMVDVCCPSSCLVFFGRRREVRERSQTWEGWSAEKEGVKNLPGYFTEDEDSRHLRRRPEPKLLCSNTFNFVNLLEGSRWKSMVTSYLQHIFALTIVKYSRQQVHCKTYICTMLCSL